MPRGGFREGAGRPKSGRKVHTVRATEEEWKLIKAYAEQVKTGKVPKKSKEKKVQYKFLCKQKIGNKKRRVVPYNVNNDKNTGALLTMNYTELSVATQDVMPNKGVLFFKSGLSDFIQVGEPIQNEDGLTFVGKLV